ncbi:unnamed protein product [Rhizophagus irregularis]|uniref:Uncharacterized protein n=1 Tax=Rhizophagus irregularis TaxID=588596 RepID=A0A915ZTW5_9GLOM|nr:unnamed protein product [Rhizophagus irregularis]
MHFRFKFCKLFAKNPFYWSININVVQNQRLTNQTYSPIVNCERIHQRFLPHKPYLSHQPHPFLECRKLPENFMKLFSHYMKEMIQ